MKNLQTPKPKNQRNIKLQPPVVCERAADLLKVGLWISMEFGTRDLGASSEQSCLINRKENI